MVISRRQASDALTIRLMSASIAMTAASTAARAATSPRIAADRPGMPSLARSACVTKTGLIGCANQLPRELCLREFYLPYAPWGLARLAARLLAVSDGVERGDILAR
jgi:hypothetical protein